MSYVGTPYNYRIKKHWNWEGKLRYQPQRRVVRITDTWCFFKKPKEIEVWVDIGPPLFVQNGGYCTEKEAAECLGRQSFANKLISEMYGCEPYIEEPTNKEETNK